MPSAGKLNMIPSGTPPVHRAQGSVQHREAPRIPWPMLVLLALQRDQIPAARTDIPTHLAFRRAIRAVARREHPVIDGDLDRGIGRVVIEMSGGVTSLGQARGQFR